MDVSIWQMFAHGWPVMTLLLAASIVSIAVMVDRVIVLRRSRLEARALAASVIRVIGQKGFEEAVDYCRKFPQPAGVVLAAVLGRSGGREVRERAMRHAMQVEILRLERRVPVLGTIGSIAPFVGLFGTVMGIIRCFRDISLNVGGGPEVVSAGIAEALITTALGLLVAIPAIVAYNYCVHQIQKMAGEIDIAGNELIEHLEEDDWKR